MRRRHDLRGRGQLHYPGEFSERLGYNKNNMKLSLPNGSAIQGYSCEQTEAIRGSNLTYAWLEEVGSFGDDQYKLYTEVLLPALRIKRRDGGEPRLIVTTTPRPNKLIRHFLKEGSVRKVQDHQLGLLR